MMKIANIFPIQNQECYKSERVVMLLAHLVKKKAYSPSSFLYKQYIIMDNGMYEDSMVSNNLLDIIQIAEKSGIPIKEIIIPDVMHNMDATMNFFELNLKYIKTYKNDYNFMFVAQHKNFREFVHIMNYINSKYKQLSFEGIHLTIGIPKLSKFNRSSKKAIKIYEQCPYPIHFLGLTKSFKELEPVKDIVRSCDTAQLSIMAKYNCDVDVIKYKRKKNQVIDLEYDKVDYNKLIRLRRKLRRNF